MATALVVVVVEIVMMHEPEHEVDEVIGAVPLVV
jgi:hypothetical protein